MLIKMFLYVKLRNWLKKYGFRRYALPENKCEESRKCHQILISKIYNAQVLWKLSEGFQETPLVESFLDKRDWNFSKRKTLPPAFRYLRKFLKMNVFWQVTFDVFQFLTKAISFKC